MRYKISKKALEDVETIWLYTAETWSMEQADRYYNAIFDEIEYLAENPTSGKDCSHIRKKYRSSKVKAHLIFYRPTNKKDRIEIIRVLHEQMDIENRLNEP
jgi:toxin ParE1/3/4